MKQLTRQEVNELIDRLDPHANKCDYCKYDGKVTPFCEYCGCEYPRGVTIGHILSKTDKKVGGRNYYIGQTTHNDELIHLWSRCGELTLSLQDIIEASGYRTEYIDTSVLFYEKDEWGRCTTCDCNMDHMDDCPVLMRKKKEVLKSPEANALFSFLQEIV